MAKPGAPVTLVAEISYLRCLHLKEDREFIPIIRSLLNPPIPGKVGYTTGVHVPYSFRTVLSVLLRLTRTIPMKMQGDVSVKTRNSNPLQISWQRQRFLHSYLKTLSVRVFGTATSPTFPSTTSSLGHLHFKRHLLSGNREKGPSIVNFKVEWLGNPLLHVFVGFFGPDRAQR